MEYTLFFPLCSGMVERLNFTVIQMIHTLSEKLKYEWKDSLSKLIYAYNCTKHSVTGYSPYFLLFVRSSKLQVDIKLSEHQGPINKYGNQSIMGYLIWLCGL